MQQETQDSVQTIYKQTLLGGFSFWPVVILLLIIVIGLFIARPVEK